MSRRLRTAVIGFGQIASGYAQDSAMARYYRYATHAQVLAEHPEFEWIAVVDPVAAARESAANSWRIPHVAADVRALGAVADDIEVAVLATPPESRLSILDCLPSLRAVLVEKPLGRTLAETCEFIEHCAQRDVLVQVNLWRRADELFRRLASGQLASLVGTPQCAFGVYGNGLLNNGTHMVDFVRMLLGEITTVTAIAPEAAFVEGPIAGDNNVAFALQLENGVVTTVSPVRFRNYRENGLDVWGEAGRLSILNEGLTIVHNARAENRAMTGQQEIAADAPDYIGSTVGDAMYHIFSNLADATEGRAELWSPASSALRSSAVIEAIRRSADESRTVSVNDVLQQAVTQPLVIS